MAVVQPVHLLPATPLSGASPLPQGTGGGLVLRAWRKSNVGAGGGLVLRVWRKSNELHPKCTLAVRRFYPSDSFQGVATRREFQHYLLNHEHNVYGLKLAFETPPRLAVLVSPIPYDGRPSLNDAAGVSSETAHTFSRQRRRYVKCRPSFPRLHFFPDLFSSSAKRRA